MLQPGQTLGSYVLEAVAGQGGMGIVYRARDTLLGRQVAIKVLRPEAAADSEAVPRFLREARIAAELQHPALPAVYEVSLDGDVPYLALEWVSGTTFRRRLDARDLSLEERLRVLRTTAEALAYAHERGVIHRDVKPGNVMVEPDGTTRLLDFGLAKHASGVGRASPLTFDTADAAVLGTLRYMAPEHLSGEAVDARIDQFSWGAMAYEALTGRAAAQAPRSPTDVFPFQPPVPCAQLAPDPKLAHLAHVVDRALSPSPGDRFPSMRALVAAWDGPTTLVEPPRSAEPAPKRGAGVFAITLTLTIGLGLLGAFAVSRRAASPILLPPPSAVPTAAVPEPLATTTASPSPVLTGDAEATAPTDALAAPDAAVAAPSDVGRWAADNGGRCQCLEILVSTEPSGAKLRRAWGALCPPWAYKGSYGVCRAKGTDPVTPVLCQHPVTLEKGECKNNRFPLPKGSPCSGWVAGFSGSIEEAGVVEARVDCTKTTSYAGQPGAPCRGLDDNKRLVEGKVSCR